MLAIAWERGPYLSDIGYVEDPSSNLKPTAAELQAGATPGFKLDAGQGGSAVGQYTRLSNNFLMGASVLSFSLFATVFHYFHLRRTDLLMLYNGCFRRVQRQLKS